MKIENFDTQYAHFEGEDIYISRAESGRRGYTCIGCKRPLEAVIQRKNPEHKSYFRHIIDPREKQSFHCSFNSKKYLERVVEKIIIDKGSILLPKVLKYPPLGSSHVPLLLREERVFNPSEIKAQQTFFLKERVEAKPSTEDSSQVKKKHIRPDVVFYGENGAPILFIEIIITHPIDDIKKAKLINLGIDTIQIDLPHGDKDELREIIEAGTNTKWVFNNEEFYTDYFSITGENRKEFPSINEQQRSFFQESSTCRRARIRELIQSIERCMETDKFLAIEKELGAEIVRIGELTTAAKSRLGKMETEQEAGLYSEFEPEENGLREAEKGERAESERIEAEQKDLEARYTAKTEKLREEESAIRRRERDVFGAEDPMGELPRRINAVSGDIDRLQGKSEKCKTEEDKISDEERRIDEQLAEFARIETRIYS
ncbi:hypothetical protein [Salinimicrobium sp. TH3]|uniref:hypothetical protein n=1 Tax=Salinimicrobium sp. TH3 TaxID=2997342 RepID=UPI00227260FE|nr:hypothetical protein [Salinimicrobium sp. TH3]MCY2685866.1 hypothetical protein [Salinimicrobium sp. TH3]